MPAVRKVALLITLVCFLAGPTAFGKALVNFIDHETASFEHDQVFESHTHDHVENSAETVPLKPDHVHCNPAASLAVVSKMHTSRVVLSSVVHDLVSNPRIRAIHLDSPSRPPAI